MASSVIKDWKYYFGDADGAKKLTAVIPVKLPAFEVDGQKKCVNSEREHDFFRFQLKIDKLNPSKVYFYEVSNVKYDTEEVMTDISGEHSMLFLRYKMEK